MNLEAIVNEHYKELNENERDVIFRIIERKESYQFYTIQELANKTLMSKSSLHRLTKKLGFSGYSEFKFKLQEEVNKKLKFLSEKTYYYETALTDIESTVKLFNETYKQEIIEKIDNADRIFLYGTGWGQLDVLSYFKRSFMSIGKFPIIIKACMELQTIIQENFIKTNDVIVVISLSGELEQELGNLKTAITKRIPIVAITGFRNNKLATIASNNLYYQSTCSKYSGMDLYSFVPIYVTVDLLFRRYLEYSIEQIKGEKNNE